MRRKPPGFAVRTGKDAFYYAAPTQSVFIGVDDNNDFFIMEAERLPGSGGAPTPPPGQ
jgi:hypothetical protein